MKPCKVRQFGDRTTCDTCDLVWDTNDPFPPDCEAKVAAHEMAKEEARTGVLVGFVAGGIVIPLGILFWRAFS